MGKGQGEPEKNLRAYLEELRLQNLKRLDSQLLHEFAKRSGVVKLRQAVNVILTLRAQEGELYEPL